MSPIMTYCDNCMDVTEHEINLENETAICWNCMTEKDLDDIDVDEFLEELIF